MSITAVHTRTHTIVLVSFIVFFLLFFFFSGLCRVYEKNFLKLFCCECTFRWLELSKEANIEPYRVTYRHGYEPYLIVARKSFVPYDERFRGYGLNKCVNVRWLAENGTTFYVLPGHFVVEDQHVASRSYGLFANTANLAVAAYHAAVRDMAYKRMPLVSQNTALLLRHAGFSRVATEDPVAHKQYLQRASTLKKKKAQKFQGSIGGESSEPPLSKAKSQDTFFEAVQRFFRAPLRI